MSELPATDWRKLHGDAFRGQRVLITGGAGFIGSHLAEALGQLGAQVIVFDDLSSGRVENLAPAGSAKFVNGSILNFHALSHECEGCRYIFHQAARASVPASVERPREFYETNVTGTLNVLEAARAARVSRVMFAASSSAYGDTPTLPKVETMTPQPLSPYASSKEAGEATMRAWANCYDVDTVSLRYFNIFGPRQTADSAYAAVIAAFAKALLGGRKPTIFGDGEQSRDFTFVHNAVHANLLAARAEKRLRGEIVNVATGVRTTLNQLAAEMRRQLGRDDLTADYASPRAGDVRHSLADLTHARSVLGYEAIVPFETGLRATLDWYRQTVR